MTDENVIDYRLKTLEERTAKLSKVLFGNGDKGVIEGLSLLCERMEQRKEQHDRDIDKVEALLNRLLWWIVSLTGTTLVAVLMTVMKEFLTHMRQ